MLPAVTIFLPVYNEEECLVPNTERLREHLKRLAVVYEIILGSNGSIDNTVRLGESLVARYPNEIRFFHLRDRGPGAALRHAVGLMRHEALLALDMDLSSDLSFIEQALKVGETHDIVIGSKKTGDEKRTFFRRFVSDFYVFCSKTLLGLPYHDYSLGAKFYRKALLERYKSKIDDGTFYVQKIVCLAHRDKARIQEIPVQCEDFRPSHFNLFREGLYRFGRLFGFWIKSLFSSEK